MSAELRTLTAEPLGTGIIEILEDMLVEARKGNLSSIAVAKVFRDGTTGSEWSHLPSYGLMLGALARLSYRMNVRMDG